MRFKFYEIKFDLTYECHQTLSKDVLLTFWGVSVNVKFDLKIDLIMSESNYIKFFFFNLHHSLSV